MAQQEINNGTAAGDGTGEILFSSFEKTNDNFTELYGVGGWAYYVDSLATPTIVIGTSYTQITIDGLGAFTNEDYLPLELKDASWSLLQSNLITPFSIGEDYIGRFDLTVTSMHGSPTVIDFIIDISGSTAGTNKAFTGYIQTIGSTPYDQSLEINFFCLAEFLANGGTIYARVDSGTVTIGRRNLKLSRISKNLG